MSDLNVFWEPSWDGKSIKNQSKKASGKRYKKAGHQDGQQDGKVDFLIPGRGRTLSPPPLVPQGGAYKFPGFGSRLGEGKGEGKPRCSNTPQDPGGVGGFLFAF